MPKKFSFDFDLIVIGSGAAGSAAATITARSGKKVAIIEEKTFGGSSPNFDDVPSATLLHTAHLYDDAKNSSQFGIRGTTVGYNIPAVRAWKNHVIKRTGAGGNKKYYEANGVTPIEGRAHFLSPHEISVNRRHISAKKILIATGAEQIPPQIQGIEHITYATPQSIRQTLKLPRHAFIIGGGAEGIATAQLLATFGTKVSVAEIAHRILPRYDQAVGEHMGRLLEEQKGVSLLTQSRVVAVEKSGISYKVTYSRGNTEQTVRTDEIILATARTPAIDIGLENATVDYSANGITVNEFLQTNVKHIFAAGDVIGGMSNTHTALLESRTAAHNLYSRTPQTPNYQATPDVLYLSPEIAHVGLSEDDCIKRDLRTKSATTPLSMITRSAVNGFRDGFVKIITDKKGVILGATIVAPHASDMIHELALAIRHTMTAADLAETPHAFLSWSEAVRITANKLR